MCCTICDLLYNSKNVKSTHEEVLILVKLQGIPENWDPGPGTQDVGPETPDLGPVSGTLQLGPRTHMWDPGPRNRDLYVGPGTWNPF